MASGRRQYPYHLIERKWQQFWDEQQTFRAFNPGDAVPEEHPFGRRHNLSGKTPDSRQLPPKFYILDMFPYPSGAGLHVGHPEGYTATDILARYKRAQGFHVLHPMGWDAFGLPAEQYAIKTGQHPRKTTEENIATFKRQIKSLGFSYDWSREVDTTDPEYFKWTQWIFLKLYNSWFNPETNKAEPIETLEYPQELRLPNERDVLKAVHVLSRPNEPQHYLEASDDPVLESKRRAYRDSKRLAYVSEAPVWWCEQLGTVLANEEVVDGKSEVGGFPVVRKPMRQWMLRITAYAEKLLNDLDSIDWSDSLKEMQRNWIGRSEGAEVDFQIAGSSEKIRVFTTRPDTLFGATYMVLSPEHKLLEKIVPQLWPEETLFYWKGQIYKNEDLNEPVQTQGENAGWHGLSAPVPRLTRAQAIQAANEFGTEVASLAAWTLKKEFADVVPYWLARKHGFVPLEITSEAISIATDNPSDLTSFDSLSFLSKKEIKIKIAATEDLNKALDDWWASKDQMGIAGRPIHFAPPPKAVEHYRAYAAGKSDLERTELAKEKTGVFTGAYAINPVNGQMIPIWIADYVLASYGTGAIMAVPAHDTRDFEFATKFNLPIIQVVQPPGPKTDWRGFVDDGTSVNSTGPEISITGLPTAQAKKKITEWLEAKAIGKRMINYKLRDWLFSRQRYWGEPFPIVWKQDASGNPFHEALPESSLPVSPPSLDDYKPTPDGQPPLARAKDWVTLPDGSQRETNTMPQWAGSCWYYLRYLDANNGQAFVGEEAEQYWMSSRRGNEADNSNQPNPPPHVGGYNPTGVDLYVGGTEHAVLHLLYARFWHKVLFDLGFVSTPEPFFKLVNQGLILGEMEFTRFAFQNGKLVSAAKVKDIKEEASASGVRLVGVHTESGERVFGQRIDADQVEAKTHGMVLRTNSQIVVDARSSKMSKARGNVVNPDDMVREYGADSLRLYEMFMGPLEMSKPWSTKGVEGVYRFLGRAWRLFVDEQSETEFEQNETTAKNAEDAKLLDSIRLSPAIKDIEPTPAQLKTLHTSIKRVTEDLDGMRFNTAISAMMEFVNDALHWETKPRSALRTFLQLLAPFAPHLAEELWSRLETQNSKLKTQNSLGYAPWPTYDPALLVEDILEIPVQVNGKLRDVIRVPAAADNAALETAARASEKVKSFVEGKTIRKVIVVPKKLVNMVVA